MNTIEFEQWQKTIRDILSRSGMKVTDFDPTEGPEIRVENTPEWKKNHFTWMGDNQVQSPRPVFSHKLAKHPDTKTIEFERV